MDVLTERESLYLQETKSERKRGETVQSVVKCSASKLNCSWKQKPFPQITDMHCSFSSLSLLSLSLSVWGCLSLALPSAVVQSSPYYSGRIFCTCQSLRSRPTRRTRNQMVTEQKREMRGLSERQTLFKQ